MSTNISGMNRQAVNLVFNYYPFLVKCRKIGRLGFTNHKIVFAYFDLPNIDSLRVFEELKTLIAYIWKRDSAVDKRKTAFTTTIDYTSNAAKMMNSCP